MKILISVLMTVAPVLATADTGLFLYGQINEPLAPEYGYYEGTYGEFGVIYEHEITERVEIYGTIFHDSDLGDDYCNSGQRCYGNNSVGIGLKGRIW